MSVKRSSSFVQFHLPCDFCVLVFQANETIEIRAGWFFFVSMIVNNRLVANIQKDESQSEEQSQSKEGGAGKRERESRRSEDWNVLGKSFPVEHFANIKRRNLKKKKEENNSKRQTYRIGQFVRESVVWWPLRRVSIWPPAKCNRACWVGDR